MFSNEPVPGNFWLLFVRVNISMEIETHRVGMRRTEFLHHTADVQLLVEASSLEELFVAALEGMNEILVDYKKIPGGNRKPVPSDVIEIQSVDQTALLIDFLNEILSRSLAENCIFNEVEFRRLEETNLAVIIKGFSVDRFDEDIKAVTYHEAQVAQNSSGNWETKIIFDI